jgi:ubiquinone/menaquinone biosynthesis C-methylase UbiE
LKFSCDAVKYLDFSSLESFMSDAVREWYDAKANYEWKRLFQDAYHRLEFIVHMHFLDKYLPKEGLILDAGGGPGRYTIELAKKGYDVILLDLSPKCLEIAKREIRRACVEDKVKDVIEGSVTNLSIFEDNLFDGVICFGPLSHLIDKDEREHAASELVRVAKKKAPIFISVINRYGVYRTILQRLPEELIDPTHEKLFSEGIHLARTHPHDSGNGFTDAYFFHPRELKELFERKGVKTLDMATYEGLSSHLQEETNKIYNDPAKWKRWMEIILKTCNDPCILGLGEHLLYVGRKIK